MITKKTKDNAGLYDTLFAEASEVLGAPIRTLDEYLLNIGALRQAELAEDYSLRFSRMPIDEPPFAINANSRQIEIPGDFKKNGIAVVGDHLAEILYFTIDRYYDTWDLLDEDIQVVAQWSYISSGKTIKSGISKIDEKDAKVFAADGKIMFGWPINNVIAETAGTIKFSIRFFKVADNHLVFNMNTVPTTVEIKNGLDFVDKNGSLLEEIAYSNEAELVSYRFQDGLGYQGGANGAAKPVYVINLSLYEDEETAPEEINFGTEDSIVLDLVDGHLIFGLSAVGTGSISYTGYKNTSSNTQEIGYFYFKSEDETAVESKTYYIKDGDDFTVAPFDEEAEMYECIAGIDATGIGKYWIVSTNTMDPTNNESETWGRASVKSKEIIIPGPLVPSIEANEHVYLDDQNRLYIEVTGIANQEGDVISHSLVSIPEEENEEIIEKTQADYDTENNRFYVGTISSEDANLYDKEFVVSVVASRNGANSNDSGDPEDVVQTTIRATHPAEVVEFDLAFTNDRHIPTTLSVVPTNLDSILHEVKAGDEITYQWYLDEDGGADIPVEGATEATLYIDNVEMAGNSYNCVVTNTVNGMSVSSVIDESKSISTRR